MSEHIEWQRRTAVRKIEESRLQSPGEPLERVFAEAASYVGATRSDVERWWKGRGQ